MSSPKEIEERLIDAAHEEYVRFPVQRHRERLRLVVRRILMEMMEIEHGPGQD